jgi:hypothetical protein
MNSLVQSDGYDRNIFQNPNKPRVKSMAIPTLLHRVDISPSDLFSTP